MAAGLERAGKWYKTNNEGNISYFCFDRGHPVVLILTIVYIKYYRLTQHPIYMYIYWLRDAPTV